MRQSPGDRQIGARECRGPEPGLAPPERSVDDLPRLVAPPKFQVREAQPSGAEENHALLSHFPREGQALLPHPDRVFPASGIDVGLGLHGAAGSEPDVVELSRHRSESGRMGERLGQPPRPCRPAATAVVDGEGFVQARPDRAVEFNGAAGDHERVVVSSHPPEIVVVPIGDLGLHLLASGTVNSPLEPRLVMPHGAGDGLPSGEKVGIVQRSGGASGLVK